MRSILLREPEAAENLPEPATEDKEEVTKEDLPKEVEQPNQEKPQEGNGEGRTPDELEEQQEHEYHPTSSLPNSPPGTSTAGARDSILCRFFELRRRNGELEETVEKQKAQILALEAALAAATENRPPLPRTPSRTPMTDDGDDGTGGTGGSAERSTASVTDHKNGFAKQKEEVASSSDAKSVKDDADQNFQAETLAARDRELLELRAMLAQERLLRKRAGEEEAERLFLLLPGQKSNDAAANPANVLPEVLVGEVGAAADSGAGTSGAVGLTNPAPPSAIGPDIVDAAAGADDTAQCEGGGGRVRKAILERFASMDRERARLAGQVEERDAKMRSLEEELECLRRVRQLQLDESQAEQELANARLRWEQEARAQLDAARTRLEDARSARDASLARERKRMALEVEERVRAMEDLRRSAEQGEHVLRQELLDLKDQLRRAEGDKHYATELHKYARGLEQKLQYTQQRAAQADAAARAAAQEAFAARQASFSAAQANSLTTEAQLAARVADLELLPLKAAGPGDGKAEIKRRLLLKWHPDKCANQAFATRVLQEMMRSRDWEACS